MHKLAKIGKTKNSKVETSQNNQADFQLFKNWNNVSEIDEIHQKLESTRNQSNKGMRNFQSKQQINQLTDFDISKFCLKTNLSQKSTEFDKNKTRDAVFTKSYKQPFSPADSEGEYVNSNGETFDSNSNKNKQIDSPSSGSSPVIHSKKQKEPFLMTKILQVTF